MYISPFMVISIKQATEVKILIMVKCVGRSKKKYSDRDPNKKMTS